MWVLGSELGSSRRAANALRPWAISPVYNKDSYLIQIDVPTNLEPFDLSKRASSSLPFPCSQPFSMVTSSTRLLRLLQVALKTQEDSSFSGPSNKQGFPKERSAANLPIPLDSQSTHSVLNQSQRRNLNNPNKSNAELGFGSSPS